MALKQSEKTLVGIALMAGSIALFVGLGLPQWDAASASQAQIASLEEEVKNLDAQKSNLNAQIVLLQKNTDIPAGIEIRTYNDNNREQIIKEFLDNITNLATDAGNKFISLTPGEAIPILGVGKDGEATTAKPGDKSATTATSTANTSSATTQAGTTNTPTAGDTSATLQPTPILSTFGYELAIRGTYDTIQSFLRAMDEQKSLLEISGITLENELGGTMTGSSSQIADPNYPIRLTARIRLALQPEGLQTAN